MTDEIEPGDRPHYALALRAVPAAVPAGRELTKAVLEEWALTELTGDATLVVSELVGNAIRYGDDIVLLLHLDDLGRLVVKVWDASPELPVPGEPEDDDEHGRGLLLVRAYADEWGCITEVLGGKIVWAVLGPKPQEQEEAA